MKLLSMVLGLVLLSSTAWAGDDLATCQKNLAELTASYSTQTQEYLASKDTAEKQCLQRLRDAEEDGRQSGASQSARDCTERIDAMDRPR